MQPAIGTKSATEFDITVTPTNNVNVKCGVYASDAVAPTADQVYANTGNSNAAVGAPNGPVVTPVEGTAGGAGVQISITLTGLTASTLYDVYCATNDGTKVLSTVINDESTDA